MAIAGANDGDGEELIFLGFVTVVCCGWTRAELLARSARGGAARDCGSTSQRTVSWKVWLLCVHNKHKYLCIVS